jgi:hypothetical protein
METPLDGLHVRSPQSIEVGDVAGGRWPNLLLVSGRSHVRLCMGIASRTYIKIELISETEWNFFTPRFLTLLS